MDSLEKNLNKSDYEAYKRLKSAILNKYPTYHRNFNFNKTKGLIAYVDSLLDKYATLSNEDDFNVVADPIDRKITNISSFASSQKDAEVLANVLLDFISNCEAALVNGLLKFVVYSIIYTSNSSKITLSSQANIALVVGSNIVPRTTEDILAFFTGTLNEATLALAKKRADVLYYILSSCFSYTKKLVTFFSRFFSEDERLKRISYKQSIASAQTLMNSLVEIFVPNYFSAATRYFDAIADFNSSYYVSNLDETVYNTVKDSLGNIYLNNTFSFDSSAKKIGNAFNQELSLAATNVVPDLLSFNAFIDSSNSDYLIPEKSEFKTIIFNVLKGV